MTLIILSKTITCCAAGETNNAEVLWLRWLLEHEINSSEQCATFLRLK